MLDYVSMAVSSVPEPASTYASLFNLYLIFALIAGVITIGSLVLFSILYRGRGKGEEPSVEEKERGNPKVIGLVVLLMVCVLTSTAYASFSVKDFYLRPPISGNTVYVTVNAFQWAWNFTYTRLDGSFKSIVGQLQVPENTVIVLNVTSIDVFHSFAIPGLRVKTDAIPGRHNLLWFQVPGTCAKSAIGKSGFCEYRIQCYELCGVGHAFMTGRLIVEPADTFTAFLNSSTP